MLARVWLLLWAASLGAWAHPMNMSLASFQLEGNRVHVMLTLPRALLEGLDTDHNGEISAQELAQDGAGPLLADLQACVHLYDGPAEAVLALQAPPPGTPVPRVGIVPGTHMNLVAIFTFPKPIEDLRIHYGYFPPGANDRCLATVESHGTARSYVFAQDQQDFVLDRWVGVRRVAGFVWMGMHHLFTGPDHMLFLLCLVVASRTFVDLVKTITAFTLAHSLTLALACSGSLNLSGRVVEPAIALSIMYAAYQNARGGDSQRAWPLAFGFGLIHGLGFADTLRQAMLEGSNLVATLFSFNLGIELGQLTLVAVFFPLAVRVRRQAWGNRCLQAASLAIFCLGGAWLVDRLS